jgi:hypothetical protein
MKSNQKITRVQLNISQEETFFFLAIVTAEPDYKLSLSINSKLKIALKNIAPFKITDVKGSEHTFSRFSYTSGSGSTIFTLVSNRSGKSFLLKKLKNVDYILSIHFAEPNENIDKITSRIREIQTVNGVINIDPDTLKDKILERLNQ